VEWVTETKGCSLADPFVMSDPADSAEFRGLFAEKFDWKSDHGDIALVQGSNRGIATTTPSNPMASTSPIPTSPGAWPAILR